MKPAFNYITVQSVCLRNVRNEFSRMTNTVRDKSSGWSYRRITAWTDGSRDTAKQKAAGLNPKWKIQQVTGAIWCRKHPDENAF